MCDDVAKAQAVWKKIEKVLAKLEERELKGSDDVKIKISLNGNTASFKVLIKTLNSA
jgi:hypothetical protein